MAGPVYLVRHAATALNEAGKQRAGTDAPVSAAGQHAIARLGQFFQGQPIAEVHTSPERRATDTAQGIAATTGARVVPQPALRPWHALPHLAGRPDALAKPLLKQLVRHPTQRHGQGESYQTFFNRFLPAVKEILMHSTQDGQARVIVTHGRNVKTLWSLLRGGGALHPEIAPHDPAPTQPGDVYRVHPHDLEHIFAAGPPHAMTKASS